MHKVKMHACVISKLLYGLAYVLMITHSLKPVDYLPLPVETQTTCAGPESFVRVGQLNFDIGFLIDEGRDSEDPSITKSGTLSACLRNAILMAFPWWADNDRTLNSFVIFQGIRTRIAKVLYSFVIFRWEGASGPPVPPLDTHMNQTIASAVILGPGKQSLISVEQPLPPAGCPSMTTRDISLRY